MEESITETIQYYKELNPALENTLYQRKPALSANRKTGGFPPALSNLFFPLLFKRFFFRYSSFSGICFLLWALFFL